MKENVLILLISVNLILLLFISLLLIGSIRNYDDKYPTFTDLHNTNIRYELTGSEWSYLNQGTDCIYTLSFEMKRADGRYSTRYNTFKDDCSLEYSTGTIYFKPDKYE